MLGKQSPNSSRYMVTVQTSQRAGVPHATRRHGRGQGRAVVDEAAYMFQIARGEKNQTNNKINSMKDSERK